MSAEISPAEIEELFPYAKVDDILAGFYTATDGRINPVDLTMALAKGPGKRYTTVTAFAQQCAELETEQSAALLLLEVDQLSHCRTLRRCLDQHHPDAIGESFTLQVDHQMRLAKGFVKLGR